MPSLIYIPEKSSSGIILSLKKQGVPLLPIDSILLDDDISIKYGWIRYDKNTSISRSNLFKDIKDKKRERTRRLVVYSGDSLLDFAKEISEIPLFQRIKPN